MAATRGYSVHSLERIKGYTVLILFAPLFLSGLIHPAWMIFGTSELGGDSDPRVPVVLSAIGVIAAFVTIFVLRSVGYIVAKEFGLTKESRCESRRLLLLPLILALMFCIPLPLMVVDARWNMMALVALLLCVVVVIIRAARGGWRRAIRNYNIPVNDLVHTLAPRWPVGSPGGDVPTQLPSVSSYARRVLAVRTSDAVAVLRLIHDYAPVETLCFLPQLPLLSVLVGVFPWVGKVMPFRARPSDESQPQQLADLVADWGGRSYLRWHGVLNDGTHVVRNEGEVRIVPLGVERFEEYQHLLSVYGAEIGIQRYYVQAGSEVLIESCRL